MKIFAKEQLSPHKYKTKEGYLICTDAILARTGKQTYRKSNFFPNAADADVDIEVDRPEKEVCDASAVASFENKPICIEHPDDDVTVNNYKDLAVGYVRDVKITEIDGQKVMTGNLVFHDQAAIDLIESGQYNQLSCGYDCEVLDESNPSMSHIRGNHVALCKEGRAGIAKIQDSEVKDAKRLQHDDDVIIVKCDGKEVYKGLADYFSGYHNDDFYNKLKWTGSEYELTDSDGKLWTLKVLDSKVKDGKLFILKEKRTGRYVCEGSKEQPIYLSGSAASVKTYEDISKAKNDVEKYLASNLDRFELIDFGYKRHDSVKDSARTITVQCYIISKDNKLLTQERFGPVWPGLAVPGGHTKADETPLEACVREVREETGLEVRQLRLFGTHNYECEEDGPSIAMLYTTTDFYGDLHQSDEGLNKWYDLDEVLRSPKCADGLQNILSKLMDNVFVVDSKTKDTTTKVEEIGETRFIEYDDKVKMFYIASGDSRYDRPFRTKEEAKEFWLHNKDFIRKRIARDTVVDVDPKEGESKEDFISRFMSATKSEYPDEKQRLAVAYSYWKKRQHDCSIKDSYMNLTKAYKEDAQKAGFRIEEYYDGGIRIWGSREKLERFKQQYDNDALISYIEIKDSVKDANTKSNLINALDVLATKFKLLKEGETWTGRKHFEFESKDVVKNLPFQMDLIDKVIDRFDNAYHCVSTYNAVLKNDGHINIVIDVDDKHAHDSKKSATDAVKAVKLIKSVKVCNFQLKK